MAQFNFRAWVLHGSENEKFGFTKEVREDCIHVIFPDRHSWIDFFRLNSEDADDMKKELEQDKHYPPQRARFMKHQVPRDQSVYYRGEEKANQYRFGGKRHKGKTGADIPARVEDFVDSMKEKYGDFHFVVMNRYLSNVDSISPHADNEEEIAVGSPIPSLSLGASRNFVITVNPKLKGPKPVLPGKKLIIHLQHGDVIVMGGNFQQVYLHEIPKSKENAAGRINLTVRRFREGGQMPERMSEARNLRYQKRSAGNAARVEEQGRDAAIRMVQHRERKEREQKQYPPHGGDDDDGEGGGGGEPDDNGPDVGELEENQDIAERLRGFLDLNENETTDYRRRVREWNVAPRGEKKDALINFYTFFKNELDKALRNEAYTDAVLFSVAEDLKDKNEEKFNGFQSTLGKLDRKELAPQERAILSIRSIHKVLSNFVVFYVIPKEHEYGHEVQDEQKAPEEEKQPVAQEEDVPMEDEQRPEQRPDAQELKEAAAEVPQVLHFTKYIYQDENAEEKKYVEDLRNKYVHVAGTILAYDRWRKERGQHHATAVLEALKVLKNEHIISDAALKGQNDKNRNYFRKNLRDYEFRNRLPPNLPERSRARAERYVARSKLFTNAHLNGN